MIGKLLLVLTLAIGTLFVAPVSVEVVPRCTVTPLAYSTTDHWMVTAPAVPDLVNVSVVELVSSPRTCVLAGLASLRVVENTRNVRVVMTDVMVAVVDALPLAMVAVPDCVAWVWAPARAGVNREVMSASAKARAPPRPDRVTVVMRSPCRDVLRSFAQGGTESGRREGHSGPN